MLRTHGADEDSTSVLSFSEGFLASELADFGGHAAVGRRLAECESSTGEKPEEPRSLKHRKAAAVEAANGGWSRLTDALVVVSAAVADSAGATH